MCSLRSTLTGCVLTVCAATFASCTRRPNEDAAPISVDAGVSFRRQVLPQLVQQCAGAKGCHGAAPTDSVALDLRESAAWDNLVGAASEVRLGAVRVQPFSPASSFLLTKLQGPLGPKEGKLMPLDPDSGAPISPSPAFDAFLHDVLERWIAQGARND